MYKITIKGLVQGIGFRPAVCVIAKRRNLTGFVENIGTAVLVVACGEDIEGFIAEIRNIEKANITDIKVKETPYQHFTDFSIKASDNGTVSVIPPDVGVCEHCLDYIHENPFISCNHCGCRYSVIEKLPYDRENTTLKDFPLCETCLEKYNKLDSKFGFAQGIVCQDCGLHLIYENERDIKAIEKAIEDIKNGKIIAVKGVGGYHLAAYPFFEETVINLRNLKGRETKPFAVMFDNISEIEKVCFVNETEKNLLESDPRPIVILKTKDNIFAESVGCEYQCGAFLPSTGIEKLLTEQLKAVIMTSANLSNSPIIYKDEDIKPLNIPTLYHKREIIHLLEDSVMKVITNTPQIIRRAKGFVPLPIPLKTDKKVLALGSDLKACFAICDKENAYLSPFFGDLENAEVFNIYKETINEYCKLFDFKPEIIACDLHPHYHSTKFAESFNLPIVKIQHHKAHIFSVMAEHGLSECIGVAFDGTGYGDDGNIWGGEFFTVKGKNITRERHLPYVKMLKGAEKNAEKAYFCYHPEEAPEIIKKALENNINTYLTSSAGRLFDAKAYEYCKLKYNSYEGEVATKFEQFAQNNQNAYNFHKQTADYIIKNCCELSSKSNITNITLIGGVFQNALLLTLIKKNLPPNLSLFLNQKVPPNDQSISLGQLFLFLVF
ncbi:MAG: carbamoyltransferase HypF [Oscillospiraceae bacterium]|jgi:hydrogenase maturation protein HypF|nr:carbamoyltransferase HypF [Oscillospiraceae bacterium]